MSNKTNIELGFAAAAVGVAVVLVLAINALVGGLLKDGPADKSDEAVSARIAPVSRLNTGAAIEAQAPAAAVAAPADAAAAPADAAAAAPAAAAPAAASEARSGEAVYTAQCAMCHATGAAGAPRLGNNGEWAPRIAKGMDALMGSALNGLNVMPPRGLCTTCSDEELQAAVQYMVDNSK